MLQRLTTVNKISHYLPQSSKICAMIKIWHSFHSVRRSNLRDSPKIHYENTRTMERLDAKRHREEQDCSTLRVCLASEKTKQTLSPVDSQSATAESVPLNKETTLLAKSPTCTPSFQKQKSSKILVQGLTTKEKGE